MSVCQVYDIGVGGWTMMTETVISRFKAMEL